MEQFLADYFVPFIEFIKQYSYAAEFLLLLACGLGLPVPEEVTLVTGGYLCATIGNNLWLTIAVCMTSILFGDWLMLLLGRKYGRRLLRSRWFRRMLTRRRLARVRMYFRRYGAKTVFFARFFAGIRVPVYFMAGTLRMSSLKFLWLDFLGAALSVPVSIWAGMHFADDIRYAIDWATEVKTRAVFVVLGGIALYVLVRFIKRSRAKRHAAARNSD